MSLLNMCTSRVGDPNPAAREWRCPGL